MNDIHILVTMPQHAVFRTFFDADAMAALEHIGTVHWNTLGRQYTQDELGAAVRGMDICVTGWGTPVFDEAVLVQADRLRLIAHTGGSVKPYVTDAVYGRGLPCGASAAHLAAFPADGPRAAARSRTRPARRKGPAVRPAPRTAPARR